MENDSLYPRIVEHATEPPGKCCLTGDIDGPFVDTGKDIVDPGNLSLTYRLYIHLPYLLELGRRFGNLVDAEDQEELESQLESLSAAFEALTQKVEV